MVKKEQRIVTGIATADNIDKVGDIVDFNASIDAFKNWEGNIREMHAPIAVGKAISHRPVKIKGEDGQEYNAIEVDAYISKGAENTWQKILDGTLRAFSIGGKIIKKEMMSQKMHNGRPVSVIKEYSLGELSLVDNPANAIAVINIVKMNDSNNSLDYVLDCNDPANACTEECQIEKRKEWKNPKGGLTAAGRRHFKQTEGANLKPGVRGAANTPEKMRRKGSFLTRFFTNPSGPMKDDKGRPTRLALSAAAWGEPVPQNAQDAAALAAKGRRLLERYAKLKNKSIDVLLEEDDQILKSEMEYFMSDEFIKDSEQGCDCGCGTCSETVEKARNVPSNPELYARVKAEAKAKFDVYPSAYANAWLVREYKKRGGTYRVEKAESDMVTTGSMAGSGIKNPTQGAGKNSSKPKKKKKKEYEMNEIEKTLEDLLNSLQNVEKYDTVKPMDNSLTDNKLSLVKKFINWLAPVDETGLEKSEHNTEASTEAEVNVEQVEEHDMDIEVLKEALGSVIDQKLNDFATSFKQEVEANVEAKIEEVTKSVETQKAELAEKLEATEKALEVQTAKVEEFAQAGAVKKSVDPEDDEDGEEIKKSAPNKSFWNNIYLPQGLIDSLGYKS